MITDCHPQKHGIFFYWVSQLFAVKLSTPSKLWGRRSLLHTNLSASFSQSAPVSPFAIFILPQSLCSLRLSSETASRTYPGLTCLILCQAPKLSARLFVQLVSVFFLSLLLPGLFPCPICLLAFLFAQRPSMPRQLPFFFLRLIIYSHLCVGTYLPYSLKFSHFLLVLPGPSMKVTGEPVKLQREFWATYIRAHPIPR